MSIYENIRFGREHATKTDVEQAAQEANAHEFIMKLPKVCSVHELKSRHGLFYL